MNRKMHEPYTMRKHHGLQSEINELIIAIKAHHIFIDATPEQLEKLKLKHPVPKWEEVIELLNRSYRALDEQRENPIKY